MARQQPHTVTDADRHRTPLDDQGYMYVAACVTKGSQSSETYPEPSPLSKQHNHTYGVMFRTSGLTLDDQATVTDDVSKGVRGRGLTQRDTMYSDLHTHVSETFKSCMACG